MIAPLFALLLPSLMAPAPAVRDADHAALHPKDAVYYLEVPDLPSLLAGYGSERTNAPTSAPSMP